MSNDLQEIDIKRSINFSTKRPPTEPTIKINPSQKFNHLNATQVIPKTTTIQPKKSTNKTKTEPSNGLLKKGLGATALVVIGIVAGYLINHQNKPPQVKLTQEEKWDQQRDILQQAQNDPSFVAENYNDISLEPVTHNEAIQILDSLYFYLSEKNFDNAIQLYAPWLQNYEHLNFFNQFERITIDDIQKLSSSKITISLIGTNTYYYYDGSYQKERRAFTLGRVDGDIKIIDSQFIRVTRSRK